MTNENLRRGSNRIFAVAVAGWVLFCLFVYPMAQRIKIPGHYESDRRFCYQLQTSQGDLADCLARAEKERRDTSDAWSFKNYYQSIFRDWFLPLVIVAPPILVYGLAWGTVALYSWIWRGFRSGTGKSP